MCKKIINREINNIISKNKQSKNINDSVKDLTHLNTYTIDESHTIEIDDAISIERKSDHYKLWVHIASPTSYIEYQSAIDMKARQLISTLYLSTNTLYMLPKVLINSIFSLSDKEKRVSISLGVIFNEDGSIKSSEIVQSLIKVNYQLDYEEADELIDYAPKEEEDLSIISTILQKRNCWRRNLGAIEILEPYGKIIVNTNIPKIKIIEPTISRQLISEAMILYGNIISVFTENNKIPVPYRVQQCTNQAITNNIKNSEDNVLYNFLLKKTMGKSYYSINPLPHYSLGLIYYLHATSPIRRYADLIVHYQLNRFLNNKALISEEEIYKIIIDINNLSKQNIMRYREDQKIWLNKWFEINTLMDYQVTLLNWINRYKDICILYFIEYKFSSICKLKSKTHIKVGDKFNVKNITQNYNDIIYFQLI
ncbi:ribonuclease catalytic domain-containing protein [Prochlorococcus marinus]|uniref:Ribonuclease II n=1 Tax=Prochlorococcus marinus XMU1408 TaxID=2213228 RepID=A0A318R1F7_PROMR|nr:ribonuclease catalytic domain-containing protein [Prochlorococcus marinus]MBW3041970.1 ribonuclease II [Prochlorococcus marinus str. XMU1408]PYE03096.1 ribonuclease II [Prochlorococcus marinus XMU1408]